VTTGAIRQLVSQAYESRRVPGINVALTGAGGDRQDGDHFVLIAPNGTNVDVERVSLDGKAEVARTFSFADSVRNFAVNGSRVAWSKRAGDSLIIFAASGPGGAAHRVTSVPAAKEDIELAWSRRGDQLAMVNERGQATITIVKVSENGAPVGAPTILRSRALEAWSLRWAADDKLLVMIAYEAGNQDGQIAVVPVNPEEPQRMLTSGEDASDDWLKISPDGKRVMFPEAVTTGTSIWRADFVPVKGSPRAAKP
jgi:Tol biopolymer transport system component